MKVAYSLVTQRTGVRNQTGMFCQMGTCQMPGSCSTLLRGGATVSASDAGPDMPLGKRVMLPIRPKSIALNHSTRSIFMMHRDGSLSLINLPLHSAFPPGQACCKRAATGNACQKAIKKAIKAIKTIKAIKVEARHRITYPVRYRRLSGW